MEQEPYDPSGELPVAPRDPIGMLWTRTVLFLGSLFRGEIHVCDGCRALTQCFRFIDGERQHRSYLRAHGNPKLPELNIPEPYANWMVCINCSYDLGRRLGLHRACCEPLIRAAAVQAAISTDV